MKSHELKMRLMAPDFFNATGAMEAFGCWVQWRLYSGPGGYYFTTSEDLVLGDKEYFFVDRRSTVRKIDEKTGRVLIIRAIGNHTAETAKEEARNLARLTGPYKKVGNYPLTTSKR